jgi:hypothetical protein
VQHQAATGVDTRLVCDAVGVDTDDAAAFRRHLLSGVFIRFDNFKCSSCATVDRTLLSVGNHDLGFLTPRELVFCGAPNEQYEPSTQLWGVQSSIGEPSVKSEVLSMLLRCILKKPGICDHELARLIPIIPLSDIRDVSLDSPPPDVCLIEKF